MGLPLLVFVVTLLGLLGYCFAGAAAATENTSSLSSLLPSLGRFTSSPPSPSRYYTNNNDVTSATTRVIEPRNSPRGSDSVRSIASHSLFHQNDASHPNGVNCLLEHLQLQELLITSIREREEKEAARLSSILRTRLIGDPLVIVDRRTSYSASTYPESTEYQDQGYTSKGDTDVTVNLRGDKLRHSPRGRRRRRRKNVDWEGDIRRKRDDNEIRRNGVDPLRQESLISSIIWRNSLDIPPTIHDSRDIVNEPNDSTRVDVDVDGGTGVALSTSKVAVIEDRGRKKTTRDTQSGGTLSTSSQTKGTRDSDEKQSSARVWERDIGTLGVTVSGSVRDTSVINGKNDLASKVAATRLLNSYSNNSYNNIRNNVNNRNRNHQRKYNNKNLSGSENDDRLSTTQQEANEHVVTSSTVIASSPSEPIATELSYGNDESALEWRKSRKIAVPMTARPYPQGVTTGVPGRSRKWPELPVVGNSTEKTTDPLERRITSAEKTNGSVVETITEEKNDTKSTASAAINTNTTTEETSSTQSPSPTQDTSMEARESLSSLHLFSLYPLDINWAPAYILATLTISYWSGRLRFSPEGPFFYHFHHIEMEIRIQTQKRFFFIWRVVFVHRKFVAPTHLGSKLHLSSRHLSFVSPFRAKPRMMRLRIKNKRNERENKSLSLLRSSCSLRWACLRAPQNFGSRIHVLSPATRSPLRIPGYF